MPPTTSRQPERIPPNTSARRSKDTSNPTPSSSSSKPSHRQTALSNDHVYGMIMWLPPEDKSLVVWGPDGRSHAASTGALCGLQDRCYDHPVLVLSPLPRSSSITSTVARRDSCQQDQRITILMITSFSERDIMEKFPSPSHAKHRRTYLPISPAGQHPDLADIPVLRLESDLWLAKKSYVNTNQKFTIPRQALWDYQMTGSRRRDPDCDVGGPRYALTRESYLNVARFAKYDIPSVSASVSIPVALPSPPPSPTTTRNTRAPPQVSPPPSTVAQRLGLTDSTRGHGMLNNRDVSTNTSRPQPRTTSTLFQTFQAERVRPDALNPGRGTGVAASRTEVTPLLPIHVYQSDGMVGRRSGSPRRRTREGYYYAGGAPSHSQTRDGLIVVCVGLALLAGAGCGVWAAWVYRAAIGRGLLAPGRWIVENGWEMIKTALRFGWGILSWVFKWAAGAAKGLAGWAWDKLKGVWG